jgi:ferric-dicitrate binding protein FerR (iron transport regulator)
MTREHFGPGHNPSAPPASAALTRNEMADYVRLCEMGESLEGAAARWAREQAKRGLPARRRHRGGIVLAALAVGAAITLLGVMVRRSRPPRATKA